MFEINNLILMTINKPSTEKLQRFPLKKSSTYKAKGKTVCYLCVIDTLIRLSKAHLVEINNLIIFFYYFFNNATLFTRNTNYIGTTDK